MRKADRLFQVVNLVRAHQPITAQVIADRLEVSLRSVYRYIDDLSASGIPIYGEPGIGYSLHANFELPPLNLSREEMQAMCLAVSMLSRSTGHQLSAAAQSLRSKLEAVVPATSLQFVDKAVFSFAPSLNAIEREYWDQVHEAIVGRQALEMSYQSLQEQVSHREIVPLGLFYWGSKWTIGAWCCRRQAYRDFRLDRVKSMKTLPNWPDDVPQLSVELYMQVQSAQMNSAK
ncbi:MAG: YafY family transcriptional regulator [Burkholderiaceae bacterium]|nr:MAG: YafY family transcriptional regulator [Burkholderiaceae bacterium]